MEVKGGLWCLVQPAFSMPNTSVRLSFLEILYCVYEQKYPSVEQIHITKTCLYNFNPLEPHLYTVKLGFTGVYNIFLISAKKYRLWVLVRTASLRRF